MIDFAHARANMVNAQLTPNGIHHLELVAAYRDLPRQAWVDPALSARVYTDEDVYLPGTQRFVLEPLVEARLLQEAIREPIRRALVLGAASLPSIAMLAKFVEKKLFVVEPDPNLAKRAWEIPNVCSIETSYREGYAKQSPYDVILVPGAMAGIPNVLIEQLGAGGRLLVVLREKPSAAGRAVVARKLENGGIDAMFIANVSTPYLSGFEPAPEFVF